MITLRNVSKSFGGQTVLDNISFTVPENGIVRLRGASGSGKTTLLRIIAGLCVPDSGEIVTGGERIAYVFQEDRLLPWLSAKKNAALGSSEREAELWLGKMGLSEHMDKRPAELSGGMRRRVALARGFAFGGDALLLDEPFTGLDINLRGEVILPLIAEYALNRPVILAAHEAVDEELLDGTVSGVIDL